MPPIRIIDPHVHLWDPRTTPRQVSPLVRALGRWPSALERVARLATPTRLVDFVGNPEHVLRAHLPADFRADVGHHDVAGIVHVEAGWAERGELGPVGETAWLDALEERPLGIVAHAALDEPSLSALLDGHAAASDRLRGVRDILSAHPGDGVHSWTDPDRVRSDALRDGLRLLAERGLTFEAWCYAGQLGDVARLAADVPEARIMLDHMGTPVGLAGPYGGQGLTPPDRARIRDEWYAGLEAVAAQPNVHCKLSGLLMPICGFGFHLRDEPASVDEIVDCLASHVLHGIEVFGVERCVFASNFPMDKVSVSYEVLWDAVFQIMESAGLDDAQQRSLVADNAAAFYRLTLD